MQNVFPFYRLGSFMALDLAYEVWKMLKKGVLKVVSDWSLGSIAVFFTERGMGCVCMSETSQLSIAV